MVASELVYVWATGYLSRHETMSFEIVFLKRGATSVTCSDLQVLRGGRKRIGLVLTLHPRTEFILQIWRFRDGRSIPSGFTPALRPANNTYYISADGIELEVEGAAPV